MNHVHNQAFLPGLNAGNLFVICVIVEAVDMCTDCEETWQTADLNFLWVAYLPGCQRLRVFGIHGSWFGVLPCFEPEYIQHIACRDEVDKQILEELRYAGEYGMLPRDVAAKLGDQRFTRFYVTARLIQMNKKLDAILSQRVAEKRGKNWAQTSFIRDSRDSTREESMKGRLHKDPRRE
jgi:hypothetical protein